MLGLSLLDRFAYAVLVLALMGTCVVVVGPHHNVALLISDIDAPEEIDRSERLPVVVTVLARGCQHFGALIVSRTL